MTSSLPPDGPEYLEQGAGSPLQTPSATPRRRRAGLIAAGAALGLAVVGGAVWAATWYLSSGPQPAQALPAATIGYASIDLDPSGKQLLAARDTLEKFPAWRDQKIGSQDDLRQWLFDKISSDAGCDVDYADDIEPWLGDRAAVAAVDTGADQPTPVFVVQVTDAGQADAGLRKIQACAAGDGGEATGGWTIDGDWALIAETTDLARTIAHDAAQASLADDDDYRSWTDEVGDAGIVNLYAAPAAGAFLADNLGSFGSPFGGTGVSCAASSDGPDVVCDDTGGSETSSGAPGEVNDALKNFQGAAATIRFSDGALELEVAGDPGLTQTGLYGTDRGDDVVATLPADTAAAIGVGFDTGWFSDLIDEMASYANGDKTSEELLADLSDSSGLDLPADAETLAGESVGLAVSPDIDLDQLFYSDTTGSEVPVALKVKGDPTGIAAVLAKLRGQLGAGETNLLDSESDGDMTVIGPNADYRGQVLADGGLGDTPVFRDVVPDAERASALFFVNFDAGDGWLVKLAGDDPTASENLEPLAGFGMSAWKQGDAAHSLIRLTTN